MSESELTMDSAAPERPLKYACPIAGCISPLVDDIGDLQRCEKCDRRVCEVHGVRGIVVWLCSECDRAEKVKLESFLPGLDALIDRIRDHKITAEEVEVGFATYALEAAEIQGSR